ncbi:protein of unknown function [Shewanella benthica]|uniref:Uncharacterized protein n=1 Tax=Shewanella benthica TaxID=43661 RepID=A0A330LXW6_9GAMM|nr:protein of unknown function [Shewanella benthica]
MLTRADERQDEIDKLLPGEGELAE